MTHFFLGFSAFWLMMHSINLRMRERRLDKLKDRKQFLQFIDNISLGVQVQPPPAFPQTYRFWRWLIRIISTEFVYHVIDMCLGDWKQPRRDRCRKYESFKCELYVWSTMLFLYNFINSFSMKICRKSLKCCRTLLYFGSRRCWLINGIYLIVW